MDNKLLIIADDFTGALDSSVQFASKGADTIAVTCANFDISAIDINALDVLVVNADTRHLTPQQAADIIILIVKQAIACGYKYIFKKTDSALRGNVGAELDALSKAFGRSVVFVPAYPKQNRITKNGIQYIDGIPVAESVFGADPFNPVEKSDVRELLGLAEGKTVLHSLQQSGEVFFNENCSVNIYDSETNEEQLAIAEHLGCDNLVCTAGCAGFAEVLAKMLGYKNKEKTLTFKSKMLVMICGSMNPITVAQMDYSEKLGRCRINLTPEEKLENRQPSSQQIDRFIKILKEQGCLIIDAGDANGSNQTDEYAKKHNMTLEEMRINIVKNMARITRAIVDTNTECTLFCTGGDTLKAVMAALKVQVLKPIAELLPGIVASEFEYNGNICQVISKSGGFGKEDLIERILEYIAE